MSNLINNNGEASQLELMWLRIAPALGIDMTDWERQHRFDPERSWRFDFARLDVKVAIEIDGGTQRPGRSRHTSPTGFQKDRWKINRATAAGWAVLSFTKFDLENDPQYVVDTINQAIDLRLQQEGRL